METGDFNSRIKRAIQSAKAPPSERPAKVPEPVETAETLDLRRGFHKPQGKTEDYPPPAPDGELLGVLYRTMEEAVCFRHEFPPNFERKATTFFGGLPLVPKSFVWPSGKPSFDNKRPSVSFSFLAQIDCRDLPAFALRHLLPHSGTLYFFFDWDIAEGAYDGTTPFSNLVIYDPEDPADFSEANPPADLVDCYDHNARHYFRWLEHTDRSRRGYPRIFPKWPVQPVVLRTFANEHPTEYGGNSAGRYQELWKAEQARASIAAFGEPVSGANRFAPQNLGTVWRPAPGFPESWISVEIFAGSFMRELKEGRPQPVKTADGGVWPANLEQLTSGYREALQQAESWIEKARTEGLFTPLTDADREKFWSWCDALDGSTEKSSVARGRDRRSASTLNSCINEAFQRGPGYCLSHSAETAALVSEEAREAVRWRHAPLITGSGGRNRQVTHQIMGAGTSIQGAPERFRDTHFLLVQFDSDYGMDWMWGDVGVVQYWITPDDLKARRFDRVIVTLEGH